MATRLLKITGQQFVPAVPSPTALDNGDGTVTFTVPGVPGARTVLLSYGADSDADDAVVDVTETGTFITDAYEASTTVYFKARALAAGGDPSDWSAVDSTAVDVSET